MTERLTLSSRKDAPQWVLWIAPLFLLLSAGAVVSQPLRLMKALPADAHPLFKWIQPYFSVTLVLGVALLGILWVSGLLLQRLLPAKSPLITLVLIQALGIFLPFYLLFDPLLRLLKPLAEGIHSPALPAWALLLTAWVLFVDSAEVHTRFRPFFAGLLAGLALSLDPLTLSGVLPFIPCLVAGLIRHKKKHLPRSLLLLTGLGIGLLPYGLGLVEFVCPYTAEPGNLAIRLLPTWTWFFMALGGLVALIQLLPVFIGLVLPSFALGVWLSLYGQPPLITELAQAWLTAYGIFRLLRGVESGFRNLNATLARNLSLFFLFLLLIAFCAWTAAMHLLH